MPEKHEQQNPKKSFTDNYQKYIAGSYGYKLVCVDDKFSKPLKTYLGKVVGYNFIDNMFEESKYCSEIMKIHFNKELMMTKEDSYDFKTSRPVTIIMLVMMLKQEIISLENTEALRIEIVISILN